jgi:hypothetical protein
VQCVCRYRLREVFLDGFFFSDFGSGGDARILRRASSKECGARLKGLPRCPAGLGLGWFFFMLHVFGYDRDDLLNSIIASLKYHPIQNINAELTYQLAYEGVNKRLCRGFYPGKIQNDISLGL